MRNFGLAACVALGLLAACTSGTLDFDFRIDDLTDDGGDGYTRDSGIRILSDATPPGRTDGSSGRGDEGGSRDTSVDTFEDRGAFEDRGVPGDRSFPDDVVGVDGGRGDVAGVDVARVDVAVDATSLGDAEGADGRVGTTDAAANRDARSDGATRDIRVEADAASSVDALGENDAAHADAVDDPRDTDAIDDHFDDCNGCAAPAPHLLITEIVTRPAGAEMIEIFNPTSVAVGLADYALSDSHLYFEVTTGAFPTASGSDFAARFPDGATLEPGRYAVVALGNASGGSQSFAAMYGKPPDFELRPTANLATDDPAVPNMVTMGSGSIGASASLTDGGEPIVLFSYNGGELVSDVDYVFYGAPSASNPMVDKTGIIRGGSSYLADTPATAQRAATAPGETGSLQRCAYSESREVASAGNGVAGHDETSEDASVSFRLGTAVTDRTPGGPPAAALCTN